MDTFTNIITPPDFIRNNLYTITIIDPEWSEIEDLSFLLKTTDESFNIYIYRHADMNDTDWLAEAILRSSTLIVNTVDNAISKMKDSIAASSPKVYYYGHKNFSMNKQRIEKPIDYFTITQNRR
jgi:hypothetical protein